MSGPRNTPGSGTKDDPNLGQKEAEQEKDELGDEDEEQDDELEPMTDKPQQPQPPQR